MPTVKKTGVKPNRLRMSWTTSEDAYLRRHYLKDMTATAIAVALDRSICSVYNRAFMLGLGQALRTTDADTIRRAIRRWHRHGWTDSEVCRWLADKQGHGVDRHRVHVIRRQMGLPSNLYSTHNRRRTAAKTRQQLQSAGLSCLAEIRNTRIDQWKRDLGWPESLTLRAVQALEVFWSLGPGVPITRLQLCGLLGIKNPKRTSPNSRARGGTVLSELHRAGFVEICAKGLDRVDDPNSTRSVGRRNFYYLKSGVSPIGRRAEHGNKSQRA